MPDIAKILQMFGGVSGEGKSHGAIVDALWNTGRDLIKGKPAPKKRDEQDKPSRLVTPSRVGSMREDSVRFTPEEVRAGMDAMPYARGFFSAAKDIGSGLPGFVAQTGEDALRMIVPNNSELVARHLIRQGQMNQDMADGVKAHRLPAEIVHQVGQAMGVPSHDIVQDYQDKNWLALAGDIFTPIAFSEGVRRGTKAVKSAATTAKSAAPAVQEGITAYHGSPHNYSAERLIKWPDGRTEYIVGTPDVLPTVPKGAEVVKDFPLGRQRLDKIGTGEGAQAYGHGLYEAEAEAVGKGYKDALSRNVPAFDGTPVSTSAESMAYDIIKHDGPDKALVKLDEYVKQGVFRGPNEQKAVADVRDAIVRNIDKTPDIHKQGHMYQVKINASPDEFLDWDKPLSQQSEKVRQALHDVQPKEWIQWEPYQVKRDGEVYGAKSGDWVSVQKNSTGDVDAWGGSVYHSKDLAAENATRRNGITKPGAIRDKGEYIYTDLGLPTKDGASKALLDRGIPGIKYLDGGTRNNKTWIARHTQGGISDFPSEAEARAFVARYPGEYSLEAPKQTRNYVVFDESLIDILKKYGVALPAIGVLQQLAKQNNGAVPESMIAPLLTKKKDHK